MKKYVCDVCGYVYDEEAGDPDNGIAPGTKWEDVPEDFVCPGFRQLNHQQMLANRRNAVFFCQILCIFMLHVLYVCGIMVLR